MSDFDRARELIRELKGDAYVYGQGVLSEVGRMAAELGNRAALVYDAFPGNERFLHRIKDSLASADVKLVGEIEGARPNAPREDLFRITEELKAANPNVIVCMGGGSTIDAAKAAEVLHTLGGSIDDYLGVGKVTPVLKASGKTLAPMVAIQTAASTGAHLTKGSNITDYSTGQKKLIVDAAIVPPRAIFDYEMTFSMPPSFTADGALDAVAHMLEVFYDSVGKPYYQKMTEVAPLGIRLVVKYLERAIKDGSDVEARTGLALGADMGGYAVCVGGTNGAHLNSFSFVDILSHGRACAMMNPYYSVFFAPAVEEPLRMVGKIYKDAGLTTADLNALKGRELGIAVAEAMIAFSKRIGFPTKLSEVKGFTDAHIQRALAGAKDSALKMKLEQMPIPLTAQMVDQYMGPVLEAA
ncbi:MAG: iron-containing alcohol dehydrogenase, partial [Chloroflexota bacterium]